ncbi:MAG: hypothetical protein WBQ60_05345 [Asticcacaulis sp.]
MIRQRIYSVFMAFSLGLGMAQCSPKPEAPPPSSASVSLDFSYDLALSMTPAASAYLKTHPAHLVISAYYYGLPEPAYKQFVTKDGVIGFKTDQVTVDPVDQTVHMTGEGIETERLKAIIGPKPLVQITIRAMRKDRQDEHIGCRVFQDYVATAQAAPLHMSCDLRTD